MTNEEFSNEFDVLVNRYSAVNLPPHTLGFNEYEKSIFLTKAQEEIVRDIYSGKNVFNDSFEKTEEIRRSLESLIKTYITPDKKSGNIGISNTSVFFELPQNLWFITYEAVSLKDSKLGCKDGEYIQVIPVTQDEYHRIKKNPFRGANDRRALRLDAGNRLVEIVSEYNIEKYLIRYLSKPKPIVLVDLEDLTIDIANTMGGTIDSKSMKKQECELNPVLHRIILDRAVRLALAGTINTGKE